MKFCSSLFFFILFGTVVHAQSGRRSKEACLILISQKEFADGHREDQPLECELHLKDRKDSSRVQIVRVKGLTAKWAREKKVQSGQTTLFVANALIADESREIIIPSGAAVQLGSSEGGYQYSNELDRAASKTSFWNRKLQTGNKKVVVLRIIAQDKSTTASEAQLTDDIFGTAGDPLNLKSQFDQCSYGQLQFQPTTSVAAIGSDGVYTVRMPTTVVTNQADNPIAWAAVSKAEADLGVSLTSIADHVIVCIPPGTSGGWIAYAYIGYWLSVFNDDWCRYPSGLMHELGHNLNFGHASEGPYEYDDQSGMMGYSYGDDDGPAMCFNGPNTWQFGWFSSYHVDLSAATGFNWSGNLIGFAERNSAAASDRMIVRIQSSTDTYVHFNRAIGFNSGTVEGGDQVLVTTRPSGTDYSNTLLVAKLSSAGVYVIPNFNGSSNSLTITVNSILFGAAPARANISILLAGSPTRPPTRAPTVSPTRLPTKQPTRKPTSSPTRKPTSSPTRQPTSAPATSQTGQPTSAPTTSPTGQPTSAPTTSPTEQPTSAPTTSPTGQPTSEPTTSQTGQPTPEPTGEPTLANDPTYTPSQNSCFDDPTARFYINGRRRTCAWFAARPKLQEQYCGWDSWPDYYCQKTCDSCWYWQGATSKFDNVCVDSDNKFWINDRIGFKTCAWLATQEKWQNKVCGWENAADFECQKTCNSCEYWRGKSYSAHPSG